MSKCLWKQKRIFLIPRHVVWQETSVLDPFTSSRSTNTNIFSLSHSTSLSVLSRNDVITALSWPTLNVIINVQFFGIGHHIQLNTGNSWRRPRLRWRWCWSSLFFFPRWNVTFLSIKLFHLLPLAQLKKMGNMFVYDMPQCIVRSGAETSKWTVGSIVYSINM